MKIKLGNAVLVQDDVILQQMADRDATELVAQYMELSVSSVLANLLAGMYRTAPSADGPEFRDGDQPTDVDVERCRQLYAKVYDAIWEIEQIVYPARRVLPRIVETRGISQMRDVLRSVMTLTMHPARDVAIPHALVLLIRFVDYLASYLLLIFDAVPELAEFRQAGSYRRFIDDVLSRTGWSFSEDEVTAACKAVMKDRQGQKASSCGLRLSRNERAEAKAWRETRR